MGKIIPMYLSRKSKTLKVIMLISIGYLSLFVLFMPLVAFGQTTDDFRKTQVSGIHKIWTYNMPETCENLYSYIYGDDFANLDQGKKDVFQSVFDSQCKVNDYNVTVFDKPYSTSASTRDGRQCEKHQEDILFLLYNDGKSDPTADNVYIDQCVVSQAGLYAEGYDGENTTIKLLAPLPIQGGTFIENSNKSYLYTYMVKIYRFVIGIAGIAAVLELIIAGFQIGMSAGDTTKAENGKKRLIQTLEGLGILFTTAIILNTINPTAYNFETAVNVTSEILFQDGEPSAQEFSDNWDFTQGCPDGHKKNNWNGGWFTCQNKGRGLTTATDYKNNDPTSPLTLVEGKRIQYRDRGPITPTAIFLHYTAGSTYEGAKTALEMGQNKFQYGLACHIMVDSDGIAYQLMDSLEEMSACQYGGNTFGIGIEIVGANETALLNNKYNQMKEVARVVKWLTGKYGISPENTFNNLQSGSSDNGVFSHEQLDSAISRFSKIDPGEKYMAEVLELAGGTYSGWTNTGRGRTYDNKGDF